MRKKEKEMKEIIIEALQEQGVYVAQDYETIIDRFVESCQNNDIPARWAQKTIVSSILLLEDSEYPESTFSWILEVRLPSFLEWALDKQNKERAKKTKRDKIADAILADISAKMLAKKD